jgi:hypothetical protein
MCGFASARRVREHLSQPSGAVGLSRPSGEGASAPSPLCPPQRAPTRQPARPLQPCRGQKPRNGDVIGHTAERPLACTGHDVLVREPV